METRRKVDALLDEITELPAAEQSELMQELAKLYAEHLGFDPLDDAELAEPE